MLLVLRQDRQQLQDEAGCAALAMLQLADEQLEATCSLQHMGQRAQSFSNRMCTKAVDRGLPECA